MLLDRLLPGGGGDTAAEDLSLRRCSGYLSQRYRVLVGDSGTRGQCCSAVGARVAVADVGDLALGGVAPAGKRQAEFLVFVCFVLFLAL